MAAPLKIIHTADNHLGKKFKSRYPEHVSEKLAQERYDALQRIINRANDQQAHFLVIAGDLFDAVTIPQRDIKKATDILNNFNGEVIVVPGNHDFYEEDSSIWSHFKKFSKDHIHLLHEYKPAEFEVEEQKVIFYPAACRSKHSAENVIGWVKNLEKNPHFLHIGIAHGNVEGLGLNGDRYFNMTTHELKSSGLDCWLLGHIHVPYPLEAQSQNPGFFFSATHTPDGFDYTRDGYCWSFEFSADKKLKMEQWKTGGLKFYDWQRELNSEQDAEQLFNEIEALDKLNSLVRLRLTGRLAKEEFDGLISKSDRLQKIFLYIEVENEVILKIDKSHIDSNYAHNSLPHRLLNALAENESDELALQLAHQMIEEVKK